MKRFLCATIAVTLAASGAAAESSGDIEAAGYTLVGTTTLPGVFDGCTRDRSLAFADGTLFACGEHYPHVAFEPKVEIYRSLGGSDWAVAIDHRLYAGALRRWRGQDLVGGRATAVGLDTTPSRQAAPIGAIAGVLGQPAMTPLPPVDPAGAAPSPWRRALPPKDGYGKG